MKENEYWLSIQGHKNSGFKTIIILINVFEIFSYYKL